ncbi:MAG: hypothetical protein ACEQSK_10925 [Sphingomonadaceae bacterium]
MENSNDTKLNLARDGITQIGKDLRAEAHSAIDKAAEQVPPATALLANGAHQGVDKVADGVEGAHQTLMQRSQQVGQACQRATETGRGYVRNSPALSVLLAAAAGYGLSRLFSARK